jgi:hypothetical protein
VVELVLLHAFERLPLGVDLVLVATTAFVAAGTGTRARPREVVVLQLDERARVMLTRALPLHLFAGRHQRHELKDNQQKGDDPLLPLGAIVHGRRRSFGARPLSPLMRGFGRYQRRLFCRGRWRSDLLDIKALFLGFLAIVITSFKPSSDRHHHQLPFSMRHQFSSPVGRLVCGLVSGLFFQKSVAQPGRLKSRV